MKRFATLIALGMSATALSACAVLKTPDPVQTYRFGSSPSFAAAAAQTQCEPVTVTLRRVQFEDASKGDRLLAVTGIETAYIGGARWISQAETLFQSSLEEAIVAGAPCVRLSPGFGREGLVLSVDVRRFETVYASQGATPEVKLVVAAQLLNAGDRSAIDGIRIDASEQADANRVAGIVSAYDRANAEAVRQIVEWLAQTVPAARPNS